MRVFRDAGWVTLGTLLGCTVCVVFGRHSTEFAGVDVVSVTSLSVFAMLVSSVKGRSSPAPLSR
jgi:hypothetical protein